jgi:hypothetical protein
MFQITMNLDDLKSVDDTLAKMRTKIWHFHRYEMPRIMDDWQTNDMHRKREFTQRLRKKVRTLIRPHSWWEEKRADRAARLSRRHHIMAPRHWSTRPILRAELKDRLYAEMTDAFIDAIKW